MPKESNKEHQRWERIRLSFFKRLFGQRSDTAQTVPVSSGIQIALQKALPILDRGGHLGDSALIDLLVQAGFSETMAWQITTFVPAAFCHALLRTMEVSAPNTYRFIDEDTEQSQDRCFSDSPIFVHASHLAEEYLRAGSAPVNFGALVGRDSLFKAVNQAMNAGADPKELQFSAVLVGKSKYLS